MRPNVLFIIADDLNAWIGALNRHPQVRTPNIDALARRGGLFVNAYCSAPYCNASRMGMFSGRLPSTNGVYQNEDFWGAPNRPLTLIEHLRAAGYYTAGAGKVFHGVFDYETAGREALNAAPWKEVENRDELWDRFTPNVAELLPDGRPLNRLFDFGDFDAVPSMYRHFDWGPSPAGRDEDLPDARVAREISEFLASDPPEPFFCAAGFYKPHLPWHVPERFFDLYPLESVSVPLVKVDDLDDVPALAREWALSPADHELVTSRGVWKQAVQGYLACISYVDALIGQVVAALDRSAAKDRTAIVLCGDNGFHLGEKLHWRKFALWEESTRVPLIYVPPGSTEARRILEPVSLIDLFPTVLEAAGTDAGGGSDGHSLSPMLADPDAARRPGGVITTWGANNHSLRTRRWRYTEYMDGGRELYDHAVDGREWTNLADRPEYASLCDGLSAEIRRQCEPRT